MKKLFSSPKRAVISICALVAILAVLGVGVVFAWNWAAEQDAIGKAAAENFAFADAGVDPAEATIKRQSLNMRTVSMSMRWSFTPTG